LPISEGWSFADVRRLRYEHAGFPVNINAPTRSHPRRGVLSAAVLFVEEHAQQLLNVFVVFVFSHQISRVIVRGYVRGIV
jgi:hypothetical protein